jgi:shikimate kinase
VKVLLVGFMGAGKSTVGPLVAAGLGLPFVDLDELVESRAGLEVVDIFRTHGEEEFRRRERAALDEVMRGAACVVAAGGGALAGAEGRELLARAEVSVWLDAAFELVLERLASEEQSGKRPLLVNRRHARELYEARRASYSDATHRIDVAASETPSDVATRVLAVLQGTECATS